MKAVNVDDVLKILHKYGKYIFVTDEKKYSSMIDEIANLKALEQEPILDKIRAEIIEYEGDCRLSDDESPSCKECTDNVFKTIYGIIDKYKAESEEP